MTYSWLVYRSRPTVAPWPATILDIARACEHNNPDLGLSGFLLFANDFYVQFLEGPTEQLDQIWAKIAADTRHSIIWTRRGEAKAARLCGLAMGYLDAERERSATQVGKIWQARRDWQESDAEALIALMVGMAIEKYPSATSAKSKTARKRQNGKT